MATRMLSFELSAVADPISDGTFLHVGDPGRVIWSPPTGEVFTRYEAGSFRAVSEDTELRLAARDQKRAEAQAVYRRAPEAVAS